MTYDTPPRTITELWYRLDKRLSLMEAAQAAHCADHADVTKTLDDHDWPRRFPAAIGRFGAMRRRRTRIRSGLGTSAFIAGVSGLLGLIAIIRTLDL